MKVPEFGPQRRDVLDPIFASADVLQGHSVARGAREDGCGPLLAANHADRAKPLFMAEIGGRPDVIRPSAAEGQNRPPTGRVEVVLELAPLPAGPLGVPEIV